MKIKTKYNDHNDHKFFCDCSAGHYVGFSWWDEEDDGWPIYMEIHETYWDNRFLTRLKIALKLIWGRPHFHSGVVLNEEDTKELVEVLKAKVEGVS